VLSWLLSTPFFAGLCGGALIALVSLLVKESPVRGSIRTFVCDPSLDPMLGQFVVRVTDSSGERPRS
jgi:hypothetical protein